MNDTEALELAIKCNNSIYDNNHTVIANLDYQIVSEDKFSAGLANIPDGSYLGKNLLRLNNESWRTDKFAKILESCKNKKINSKWFSLKFSRDPKYWLIIINFQPLINYSTENIVGFKITGEIPNLPLQFYGIKEIINNSNEKRGAQKAKNDKLLSNREHEVLFLLFYCGNYQQVADLLSLSHGKSVSSSMVAKIVSRNLYTKFDVVNLESLMAAGHKLGYHKNVPLSLFGEFMFPLSKL